MNNEGDGMSIGMKAGKKKRITEKKQKRWRWRYDLGGRLNYRKWMRQSTKNPDRLFAYISKNRLCNGKKKRKNWDLKEKKISNKNLKRQTL